MYVCMYVCQRAFSLLAIGYLGPRVQILHSAEEHNLSPFDLNIACLCQSIEINNNKYVCMYVYMYVYIYIYLFHNFSAMPAPAPTVLLNIYSAKKETHMWFNRNFFRYGVYMTETTIYDWNQQFVRNQNLFVNLLLCETGVCSGPLSATRSITCVATSCFLHCSASAWHGWNQTCNLCMWDVIPGLLDSQTQLWEGLRRWVTWPYASINKVPQMLDRGQVGGICWPGQYLDSISSQKVLCEAGRVRASIILLKR